MTAVVWGYIAGAGLTGLQMDQRNSQVIAWTLAGLSAAGLAWYIGRDRWRRHQGPGLDIQPRDEVQRPGFEGVTEPMPDGPGYRVRSKVRSYGTPSTIAALQRALARYVELRGGAGPQLVVLDISRQGGGEFPPHVSHQTGRDVDIKTPGWPTPNYGAVWDLVRALAAEPTARVVFFSGNLQANVQAAADAAGQGSAARDLLGGFEKRGFVRNWPGHRSHLHVRFTA